MTTLYVDSQIGTAGGAGTAADPLSTITLAVAAASAADTLLIRGGNSRVYREQVTLTKQLTLTGYGTADPDIVGSVEKTGWTLDTGSLWYVSQATDPLSVYFVSSAGVLTKGARKTTAALCVADYDFAWIDASDRLYVYATADPVTLHARVEMCSLSYGIAVDGVNGCVVSKVRVLGQKLNGLNVDNVTSFTASDVYIGFQGTDGVGGTNATGFALSDFTVEAVGATRPATSAAIAAQGDGLSFSGTSTVTLSRGTFRDCLTTALNSVGTTTTTANRLRIDGCNAAVLAFHSGGTLTLRNSTITMNSDDIGGIGVTGTTVLENVGIYGAGAAVGDADHNIGLTVIGTTTFRNLWITNCRVGISYVLGTLTQGRAIVAGNGTDDYFVTLGTAVIRTAPTFVNAAGGDFRLAADSSGIQEGVSLAASFTDDIGGRRRATLWDIGPYAYEAPPRERVMAALVAALETVGDPDEGEWETDDAVVAVHRNGLGEDGARLMPCIEVTRTAETLTLAGYSGTSAMYDRVMTVEFTYATEGWNATRDVGPIVSDVEKALGTDRTLGATCSQCLMVSNESQANGEECAVRFTVSIRYRTSDTTPTLRV